MRKNLPEPVRTVDNNVAQSVFRIMDCYFSPYVETEIKKITKEELANLDAMINQLFFFGLVWAIGVTTTLDGRIKFDKWVRDNVLSKLGFEFPQERLVYDYKFNIEDKSWVYWRETVPEYTVDIKSSFNEILVPTVDSIRMKYFIKTLVLNNKHVLTPGPTGTGKSVNIAELLTYELPEEYQTLAITFSAQTSANQTQDYLDDKFEKRRKGVYGPPIGKKFVIFIDDLNMPKKEEYGAQPPLELLRQWMDYKGWYDRKDKERPFKKIEDIIFIAAMGPPGGGRSEITGRLQRHFNIMTYTDLQDESIHTIFYTIITAFMYNFTNEVKASLDQLVQITLKVYNNVLYGPLRPTPNKSHYTFNLRDISRIF
jgi:dynein heavy chain